MSLKLYKFDPSPPARATMMACDIHSVPVDMVEVNLIQKQHMTPEFLKKNPVHTIPVLKDGDLHLHDSHAILIYLTEVYGKDDTFYPKNVKQRALVNQKLFFNNSILFPRLRNVTYSILMEGAIAASENQLKDIDEAYGFLEEFLTRTKYLAGDHITLADIAAIATVTSLVYILPLDGKKYPKTQNWIKEMERQPYCQKYNADGAAKLGAFIKKTFNS